jgi:tetratricopeptide (TPR) repeat protein
MVFDPDGTEVDWIVGYDPPADKFQAVIEKIIRGEGTFKSLSAAYAKDPKAIGTVFALARKWSDRNDTAQATEKYGEVLALDPDGKLGTTTYNDEKVSYTQYAEYCLGLSAVRTRQGKPDPAPLLAFVKKYPEGAMAKEAYGSLAANYFGRSAPKADAAKFFEEYTNRYPKEYRAVSLWVRRIIQDKEPLDKGLDLALKSIDLAPGQAKINAYQNLAQVYLLKGDKAKAAETAESLIKTEEERIRSSKGTLGMALIPSGSLSMGSSTYLLSAARIFIDADQKERALAVFGPEYLKNHMDETTILSGYASFWSGQSLNLNSARAAAAKGVELAPDAYRDWMTLSQIQMKLKQYDEALKAAEKALALAPAQPPMIKDNIKKSIERIKSAQAEKK